MAERKPRRKYHLVLNMGADSRDDLSYALRDFADKVDSGVVEVEQSGASGGPTCGSTYQLYFDEKQTNANYYAEIAAWQKAQQETTDA